MLITQFKLRKKNDPHIVIDLTKRDPLVTVNVPSDEQPFTPGQHERAKAALVSIGVADAMGKPVDVIAIEATAILKGLRASWAE